MQNDGSIGSGVAIRGNPHDDLCDLEKQDKVDLSDPTVLIIVVSNGESIDPLRVAPEPVEQVLKTADPTEEEIPGMVSPKKPHLSRNSSCQEQCRVCQQEKEEYLIDLGCQCRGGLAKAHRSCIDTWFRTRGSNRCEICQHIAKNVPPPTSQPSTNYCVWRVDPALRGSTIAEERESGCFNPLWVAFSILVGGLVLDVLISITLGVSALPVNIIIGVIVVLGLGTAIRLALEFCHEWSARRTALRVQTNVVHGYHPAL